MTRSAAIVLSGIVAGLAASTSSCVPSVQENQTRLPSTPVAAPVKHKEQRVIPELRAEVRGNSLVATAEEHQQCRNVTKTAVVDRYRTERTLENANWAQGTNLATGLLLGGLGVASYVFADSASCENTPDATAANPNPTSQPCTAEERAEQTETNQRFGITLSAAAAVPLGLFVWNLFRAKDSTETGQTRTEDETSDWEKCETPRPISNVEMRLSAGSVQLRARTNNEGVATFDLTKIETSENNPARGTLVLINGEKPTTEPVALDGAPSLERWLSAETLRRKEAAEKEAQERAEREREKAAAREKAEKARAAALEELKRKAEKARAEHAERAAALEKLKSDCSAGNAESCFAAGRSMPMRVSRYGEVFGDPISELFDKGCKLKHEPSCGALQQRKAAIAEARRRIAQQKAADAERETANRPRHPILVDIDSQKERCSRGSREACALMTYADGCRQGMSDSCDSAGNAYIAGIGGRKDLDKTKIYWRRACEISPARCVGYGIKFYNTGNYRSTAEEFFETACDGDANQCGNVGLLYQHGAGRIRRDRQKAMSYFERGCNANSAQCCQLKNSR